MGDLVQRSGKGDHREQLGRIASSEFIGRFLLLEGDYKNAGGYVAYGAEPTEHGKAGAVKCKEDVLKLE
eukprot:1106590-Prorocentrum_minimum.AAC.1